MKANKESVGELSGFGRHMLALQGYSGVSEARLAAIRPWLRVAPALTAAWLFFGTLVHSAEILWVLVPFTVLGAVLPLHPFDVFYNHIARHVLGGPMLPASPLQRRLCCAIAGGWAAITALLLQGGYPMAAMWTGGFATFGCVLPAITEFCIPSFIMHLLGARGEACEVPLAPTSTGTLPWWTLGEIDDRDSAARTLYVSGRSERANASPQRTNMPV